MSNGKGDKDRTANREDYRNNWPFGPSESQKVALQTLSDQAQELDMGYGPPLLPKGSKVLVACEFSGVVRSAFIAKGHDAISCDIIPSEVPGPHYIGDVLDVLDTGTWDLMIAHPPCTYLTVAAAKWFYHPDDSHLPFNARRPHPDYPTRRQDQKKALEFVQLLMDAPIPRICIENPIGKISTAIRKPEQIIQPYQFGHDASKSTCLWLKGLPTLTPTKLIEPRLVQYRGKMYPRWGNQCPSGANNLPRTKDRGHKRSITYDGIAKSMAETWSDF